MSLATRVAKNVASSWVGFGVQVVVTLLLTPVVLSRLGIEAYGIWLLLQGFVGYYGFVDMGLRAGITQSITRRIATKDHPGLRQHIATARPVLLKLSLVVVSLSIVVSVALPHFVETSPELNRAFQLVVVIQGIGVALRLPLMPYGAVIVGCQRYDLANTIAVLTKVAYAIAAYIILTAGGRLVALSITLVLANLLDSTLRVFLAHKLVPELSGGDEKFARADIRELMQFGVWNFMLQIGHRIVYYSDTLVVGVLFSAAAIAPYGLAGALVDYCSSLIKISTRVLYPTMSELHHNGRQDQQRSLYYFSTRISLIVSSSFLIIGYMHLQPFLRLWLARSPDADSIVSQAPSLFLTLGIAYAFVSMRRAGTQLLLAAEKQKQLAIVQFSEAILNLTLSIALGLWIGIPGVAWGTLIPAAILGLCWHLKEHANILGVSRYRILNNTITGTFLYSALLTGACHVLYRCLGDINNWGELLFSCGLSVAFAGALFPLALSQEERSGLKRLVRQATKLSRKTKTSQS